MYFYAMQKFRSLLYTYINFASKRHWLVVLIVLGLALWCALGPLGKIRLDADLDDLLPRNTPTILAMKESNQRFGSADLFTIAIQSDSPVLVADIQREIKNQIEKNWEDALYVQDERDNSFFVKNALLYLPIPHLEHILENLVDLKLELGNNIPLVVDLFEGLDEEEDKPKERVWFDASIAQELGLPDEAADAFTNFLKPKEEKGDKKAWNPKKNLPDSLKNKLIGYHRDGTWNGVVQAALKYPSSDTKYVKEVLDRTEVILKPIREKYGDKIDVGVEGSYQSLQEVESLAMNGIISTSISIVLVILIIAWYFRSIGAFIAIIVQVIVSCMYTAAFTYYVYGRLNMYTAFVFAIILGMGIDYSIHIMGHAQKGVFKGQSWQESFVDTLQHMIKPILLAAITTIAGLLTLLAAKFVGFYEFGVIASAGIVFSVITAFTFLPALVFLFQTLRKIPILGFILALPTKAPKFSMFSLIPEKSWPSVLKKGAITIAVGSLILTIFIPQNEFEHDFKNLRDNRPKDKGSNRHVGVAIQSNRKSSQPIVALAQNPETMVQLHDTLLHRLAVEKDSLLRSFLTLSTFVPPESRQEDRMEIIEEIADEISARVFDKAEGKDSMMIAKLRDMTEVEPFGAEEIPPWALRLVQERDGSYGKIAFIYGSYNSSDSREAAKFQDRYGHFELNGEHLKMYSSSFIYADIIRLVKSDSLKMAWMISLIIALTLALTLRSVKLFIISILGLFLGIFWTVGWMGLLGLKLGPFNLIVIPSLLGVSVDSVIHLTLGYQHYKKENLAELFSVTGSLVSASVITTLAGYAGMLFTTHQGIGTIGQLAITGFFACLVVSLIITPWACLKLKA